MKKKSPVSLFRRPRPAKAEEGPVEESPIEKEAPKGKRGNGRGETGEGEKRGPVKPSRLPRWAVYALPGLAALLVLSVLLLRGSPEAEPPASLQPPPPPVPVVEALPSSPPPPSPGPAEEAAQGVGAVGEAGGEKAPPPEVLPQKRASPGTGDQDPGRGTPPFRDPFGLPPRREDGGKPEQGAATALRPLPPPPKDLPPPPLPLPKAAPPQGGEAPDPFAGVRCLAVALGGSGAAVIAKEGRTVVLSVGEESPLVGTLKGVSQSGCELAVAGKRKFLPLEGEKR